MVSYRLGFDIGGTFTDLIAIEETTGNLAVVKCSTTPADPSIGVVTGLKNLFERLAISGAELSLAVHSTTLVTNTVLEKKGARTALITTKGFRDVLEIGREKRITIYDIFEEKLAPVVPRHLRFEVDERTLYNGKIERRLDQRKVTNLVGKIKRGGVQSIAVSFLHSYSNPAHEQKTKKIIAKNAPGVSVSISSEILPEWREYERTSTTVINAYAQPRTAKYMHAIEDSLREFGFTGPLFIMQSSGGLTTVDIASQTPVRIIESGPAAGALAAAFLGKISGSENMISFDMGGTTAKCCLITRGEPRVTTDFEVAGYLYLKGSGYPVRVPTVDLLEIGAGGGSIAHLDYGLVKVGPDSAGADPGPACYPNGGEEPTVTDADLVLGYLNPNYFLGGEIKLDKNKSEKALEENIAAKLGIDVERAAAGVYDIVNANMSRAMRIISVERGQDPTLLSIVAFGGAGPVHAARLARQLKIRRLVVPLAAGVTSALGLLIADMKFDLVRTFLTRLETVEKRYISEYYEAMRQEANELISGTQYKRMFLKIVDMRYAGQAYELAVPFGQGFADYDFDALKENFLGIYQSRYGYTTSDPIECVNWRLIVLGVVPKVSLKKNGEASETRDVEDSIKGRRKAYFVEAEEGFIDCNVYDRYKLFVGAEFKGPVIVEERESTCVVAPGQKVKVDEFANLIIEDTHK